jgi:hypothetical protein
MAVQYPDESAMLISLDGGKPDLHLGWILEGPKISANSNYEERSGANNPQGSPKTSFNKQLARQCQMQLMFDGYDGNINVYQKYIVPLQESMNFVANMRRPPVYELIIFPPQSGSSQGASERIFRRCFVKSLDSDIIQYTGVPTRAIANITLIEVEDLQTAGAVGGAPNPTVAQRGSGASFFSQITQII